MMLPPPMSGKKYWIVINEIRYDKLVANEKVYNSYSETFNHRKSGWPYTDSYAAGFDTEQEALETIKKYNEGK